MLLTKEKIMTDTDVTLQFQSHVLGREAGETATFARTPLVDGLIANGHARVIAERPVEPAPAPEPAEEPKRRGPRKTDPDPAPEDPADG